MRISHCSLYFGLRHGNFKARPEFQKRFQTAKKMAFSLVDEKRSLDVVCQTSHDIESGESALHTLARRVALLFVRLDLAAFRWMLTLHVAALIFCATVLFTRVSLLCAERGASCSTAAIFLFATARKFWRTAVASRRRKPSSA